MCDTLNGEPLMIDDIKVDFIPYSENKGDVIANHAPIEHLSVITPIADFVDLLEEDLPF